MISSNITGAAAYAAVQDGLSKEQGTPTDNSGSFGSVLQNAVTGLANLGQDADTKSVQAMSGTGNLNDMVMAVSKAEMALDATVAVRDKVISAYQEIMRMSV
jgi:flagellar hook-basal body complex protein FliE